jgi:hypothetical protein
MRKTIRVTYNVDIDICENNPIVKEYVNERSLLFDIASYNFSFELPVINSGGVKILHHDLFDID